MKSSHRQPERVALYLRLTDGSIESFISILCLGILEAIRRELVSPRTGSVTLGAPHLRHLLEELDYLSPSMKNLLGSMEELGSLEAASRERFLYSLERQIEEASRSIRSDGQPWWMAMRWLQPAHQATILPNGTIDTDSDDSELALIENAESRANELK